MEMSVTGKRMAVGRVGPKDRPVDADAKERPNVDKSMRHSKSKRNTENCLLHMSATSNECDLLTEAEAPR